MDNRPIGIFDSGLGGLTVLKEIKKQLPNENIIYLGDTARVPYGNRSRETIIEFSLQDAKFLLKNDVKCIVVACNTASSYAVEALKEACNIPVFDVVSAGSKLAGKTTHNYKIGIIGTRATINSQSYISYLENLNEKHEIYQNAAPLLVPLIEEGEFTLIDHVLEKYLLLFKNSNIDTLIMGCTHYPIIQENIKKKLNNKAKLVNPGTELASELKDYLMKFKLVSENFAISGKIEFYVTDINENFLNVAKSFLGMDIQGKVKKIQLE